MLHIYSDNKYSYLPLGTITEVCGFIIIVILHYILPNLTQYSFSFRYLEGFSKHLIFGHGIQLGMLYGHPLLTVRFMHKFISIPITCTCYYWIYDWYSYKIINNPISWFKLFRYDITPSNYSQYGIELSE